MEKRREEGEYFAGSRWCEGTQRQSEEAYGQQQLCQSHKGLSGERRPGRTDSSETWNKQQVGHNIEHEAGGCKDVELPQVSASGQQGAEDIGQRYGYYSKNNDTEHRHVWGEIVVIKHPHQRVGQQRAGHGASNSEKHHRTKDDTENSG